MERNIDSARLRAGFVIKAHMEVVVGGVVQRIPELFWIRRHDGQRDLAARVLVVEDLKHRRMEIPAIAVLDGRHDPYRFDGIFRPSELGLVTPPSTRIKPQSMDELLRSNPDRGWLDGFPN